MHPTRDTTAFKLQLRLGRAGETLYSRFTVNGNLVTTRFELRGVALEVELTMYDVTRPRVTKLTGGAFEVASFSPKYVQRGTRRRRARGNSV